MTFTLDLPPEELDFELCLFCGQVFRFERLASDSSRGSLRFLGFDGQDTYHILQTRGGWEIEGDRGAFERLFRFDMPHERLHRELVARGAEMAELIAAVPGLRTMRPSSAHETFFCFLCSSNNHISRITQMIRTLASFGEGGRFPEAGVIAEIGEARLREMGFGYRAFSISRAAGRLAAEPALLDELRGAAYGDAFAELLTFNGVGPKLADCICLYSLDKTEAVPVDTHMWQAFTRVYRPDWASVTLTARRMRDVGEAMRDRFGEYAGFAQHYLFVENLRRSKIR